MKIGTIVVGGIAIIVAFAAVLAVPLGFFLMLSLGIIHSHVPAWPALTFGESYVIGIALAMIFSNASASAS